jgi:hypothetical protein
MNLTVANMAGNLLTVSCMGERRSAYRFVVGKPEGRSRYRGEDIIKMNLREGEWGHGVDQSGLG